MTQERLELGKTVEGKETGVEFSVGSEILLLQCLCRRLLSTVVFCLRSTLFDTKKVFHFTDTVFLWA